MPACVKKLSEKPQEVVWINHVYTLIFSTPCNNRMKCSPYLVGETYRNTEERDCVKALKMVRMVKGFKEVLIEVTSEAGYSQL